MSDTSAEPVARVTPSLRLEWLVDNEAAHTLIGAKLYTSPRLSQQQREELTRLADRYAHTAYCAESLASAMTSKSYNELTAFIDGL